MEKVKIGVKLLYVHLDPWAVLLPSLLLSSFRRIQCMRWDSNCCLHLCQRTCFILQFDGSVLCWQNRGLWWVENRRTMYFTSIMLSARVRSVIMDGVCQIFYLQPGDISINRTTSQQCVNIPTKHPWSYKELVHFGLFSRIVLLFLPTSCGLNWCRLVKWFLYVDEVGFVRGRRTTCVILL